MKYLPMKERCLSWEQDFSKYTYLIEGHLERIGRLFFQTLSNSEWIEPYYRKLVQSLPEENLIRLIASPNVAEILNSLQQSDNPNQIASFAMQLLDFVAAEAKLAGIKVQGEDDLVTTSTSDVSFQPDFHVLTTWTGIPIEYHGNVHRLGLETVQPLSYDEAIYFVTQIDKALDIIGEVSPNTLSLINNFTTLIHLRKDSTKTNYSSWSNHIGIGKITGSNFRFIADKMEEIIDFIIHESIHNFLHLQEMKFGDFLKPSAFSTHWIEDKVVPSPWSGVSVCLGSYTHAIGVWYGLAQFWKKAYHYQGPYKNELDRDKVDAMFSQACKGFLKPGSVHAVIGDKQEFYQPDYLAFSQPFQEEIRFLA